MAKTASKAAVKTSSETTDDDMDQKLYRAWCMVGFLKESTDNDEQRLMSETLAVVEDMLCDVYQQVFGFGKAKAVTNG